MRWLTLSEVFTMKNGYTPSKANKEFWDNGTLPWFRMEDIRENGRVLSDSIQHITPQAVKGKLFPANSIIMATTATIGEHALLIADSLANQQFTFFTKNVNRLTKLGIELDMKYAFYYFYVIDEWCKVNTNVSSFPSVDMGKLKNYMFPIPSIEEQERIVSILDRFDTLCNDITAGLPAEIEARKKQYEYYRDKLLSFKELKVA
ncbi:MAG: restriction endonuclease subunit S [Oscillospiraceae bacterium]|nr:restriction endonuclease subunit S [Oscillospiraceae bacterium]